jgi:hypothetical protein
MPGVEDELVVHDWITEGAFFGYRDQAYNTDFGLSNYAGRYDFPELHFALSMRRDFMDAFLTHLVPLLVVAALLFVILLRAAKEEMKAIELVGSSSGLFFLVLLAHVQLRDELTSSAVVYLEYFFLLMYLYILGVTVITFSETTGIKIPLMGRPHYPNARWYYWPVLAAAVLLLTLWKFY